MFHGFVQQNGMYETLDLVITDSYDTEYEDYYTNSEQWYLAHSGTFKEVIKMMWYTFISRGKPNTIKVVLEDTYVIDDDTIKVMFAEDVLLGTSHDI